MQTGVLSQLFAPRRIVDQLRESIGQGTRPLVTPEHALHVLEIMLKAQQSGREGRAIPIESSYTRPELSDSISTEAAHLMHDRTREHFEPVKGTRLSGGTA